MDIWDAVPKEVRLRCPQIDHSRKFSDQVLANLRANMTGSLEGYNKQLAVVLAGSFGRKEASERSDVDALVLFEDDLPQRARIEKALLGRLEEVVKDLNKERGFQLRMALPGAFSNSCVLEKLLRNIGGNNETNHLLTQRISLLVEGQGISTHSFFKNARRQILLKYLKELQPVGRRPIFLVNDLARYYRTVCVDYEYKKNEVRKPWAIRLIKLRHSRKLFYFSALFPVLESMAMSKESLQNTRWIQQQFLDYTPLERIVLLLKKYGKAQHWEMLIQYNSFLELLASKERRAALDTISFPHRKRNKEYLTMRDNAREFRKNLIEFMLSIKSWRENIEKYVIC